MPDMPHEDLNLGTAAPEPEAQPVAAPDMNLYWYPPGKTEPELRPITANAPVSTVTSTVTEAEDQASEPVGVSGGAAEEEEG